MAEAGLPGYTYIGWVGVAAPAGVSKAIVDRLWTEILKITTSDEGRAWFAAVGADPGAATPDEFAAAIRTEYAKWGKLIKESGIHVD
jgi:tripartite-type tricarboxylate transporter receptor subunit TctC